MAERPLSPGLMLPRRAAGSGSGSRYMTVGCLVLVIALIAFLVGSVSTVKRSMTRMVGRASDRVAHRLPFDISSRERQRTLANLERLEPALAKMADPQPVVGGFLSRVAQALADDHLTAEEVGDLNRFLESALPPAAGPAPSPSPRPRTATPAPSPSPAPKGVPPGR